MENVWIFQGLSFVQKAMAADRKGECATALAHYTSALQHFFHAIKDEKNPELQTIILQDISSYLKPAEEVLEFVKKEGELDKDGRGGSAKHQGENSEPDDDETAKLQKELSSAIVTEKPNIHWEDVAGLDSAKETLKETVIMPTLFPHLFTGKGKPFKGILLYGPPGTGKSFLAKAVATETNSTFFSISSSNLISKWQGESERLVRTLFELARGSEGGRSIIFIDEVDSLCGSRSEGESDSLRRVKTEFMIQMDGVGNGEQQPLLLAATNLPWELDKAILRRFPKRVYIPLPDAKARGLMVRLNLKDELTDLTEKDFEYLGKETEGASGSDITHMVNEALGEPRRKCQRAKQFTLDADGFYHPCENFPNCPVCPEGGDRCKGCGALHTTMWKLTPREKVKAPMVHRNDFVKFMKPRVASKELKPYEDWTKKNAGQIG